MGALTVLAGVLLAALAAQLAFEFREWTPRWVELLVEMAVRRLPADLQDRMGEEWRDHVSRRPGYFAKLLRALSLNLASIRVACELSGKITPWHAAASRGTGIAAICFFFPMFVVAAAIAWRGGPLFERLEGKFRFRTNDEGVRRILIKSSLNELPSLWDVVTGDLVLSMRGHGAGAEALLH